MSELTILLGKRLRSYRKKRNLSQEKLAELSGCHPTYIGQIERGEKNATVESIEKIAKSLGVSLSELFDKLEGIERSSDNFPLKCYDFVVTKSEKEQEKLYSLLKQVEEYKKL